MSALDPADLESILGVSESVRSAQWWLLFAILVANKTAETTEKKLRALLNGLRRVYGDHLSPFDAVRMAADDYVLMQHLRVQRVGQYRRIQKAFTEVVDAAKTIPWGADPRTWTVGALESVSGIGPKTARWFYLLCHPEAPVSALDTHVLKFLRDIGEDVPKATLPAGQKYAALESRFCKAAADLGMKPRDLDFFVWVVYRNGGRITSQEGSHVGV